MTMSAMPANAFLDALPRGRLAENVLHFVRVLRGAGIPVGPAKVLDALAAVEAVGLDNRTDFREALAAVLVSRREQQPVFEQAFELFWRNPHLLEKMLAALLPKVRGKTGDADELPARLAQAMLPPAARSDGREGEETDVDAAFSFSAREVLQHVMDGASLVEQSLRQLAQESAFSQIELVGKGAPQHLIEAILQSGALLRISEQSPKR